MLSVVGSIVCARAVDEASTIISAGTADDGQTLYYSTAKRGSGRLKLMDDLCVGDYVEVHEKLYKIISHQPSSSEYLDVYSLRKATFFERIVYKIKYCWRKHVVS